MKEQHPAEPHYLTCERNWVYFTLIAVAGFWGAYTYLLRGNVFCNAQTGNVVLMGLALGSAEWAKAGYYLVPISAYILGAFVSELLPNPIKHRFNVRWDTVLMLIEMIAVLGLGFLPETAPVQICQVVINFVASMQYNTFRQAEGVRWPPPLPPTTSGRSASGWPRSCGTATAPTNPTAASWPATAGCCFSSSWAP